MSPRLDLRVARGAPPGVEPLRYEPERHRAGVLHLGPGAFHRAHQATYFDEVLVREGGDWRIHCVALQSERAVRALGPQQGLYTLAEAAGAGERRRLIGAIAGVEAGAGAAVRALADSRIQVVTLTITEKGYRADAGEPSPAVSALTAGLGARRAAGAGGLSVLACDNLPSNGQVLRAAVLQAADPQLADWIECEVAFPCSVVDRITPATRPEDLAALEAACGYQDEAFVRTEPFHQWVLEDRFAGAVPDLSSVGVTLTVEVAPYEAAKLRMLNGAHTLMAHLGRLRGLQFVHEAVAEPSIRGMVDQLMAEAARTVAPAPGQDLAAYARALLERFANTGLQHRLDQIATDASQKVAPRLIGTVEDHLAAGRDAPAATLAIAAWMADVLKSGGASDPQAPALRALSQTRPASDDAARRLLALVAPGASPALEAATARALRSLLPA